VLLRSIGCSPDSSGILLGWGLAQKIKRIAGWASEKNYTLSNKFLPCHKTLGLMSKMQKTPATINSFKTL
jgi:hypothetical protein